LAEYNQIVPDAAERILAMAESQAAHRQRLETIVIQGSHKRANLGLVLGFVICLAFLGSALSLVLLGHTWPGTIIGTVDIVGLVSAFIYGSHLRKEERQDKIVQMAATLQR
jgi:uncharacterized membrane protein